MLYRRLHANFRAGKAVLRDSGDEREIVRRCLAGETDAFAAIVERYGRVLYSVAYRMSGNHEDARDIVQNAFVRAYQGLSTFDAQRPFFSWIYRIAVNESIDLVQRRRPGEPLADELSAGEGPFERAVTLELGARVQAALGQLPPDSRQVLVLRHFADLSYEEMSEVLGIPEKTVKSRLFTARRRLAALLDGPRPEP